MEHDELCNRLGEFIKKHSTGGIDFADAVGKHITHGVESGPANTSSLVIAMLPGVEGSILLGRLLEDLKTLGEPTPPILFRDPGKTRIEILGRAGDRMYKIQLVSDDNKTANNQMTRS